jgi:CRP/FNR family transcriptional regulator, cyclic AMP receptor protein
LAHDPLTAYDRGVRLGRQRKSDLLAKVPLFVGLSKKELAEVASIADELDVPPGRELIREGERGREFFVLVDGSAVVTRRGRKVNEVGPGSWLGEIALVAHVPRTATVTTTSPVRLLVVTEQAFAGLMTRIPGIAVKVLQSVGERLAEFQTAV